MTQRLREIPTTTPRSPTARSSSACSAPKPWRSSTNCAASASPAARRGCSYEVLGDIWVVQRNPYLQDDLLANRDRRGALVESPAPPPRRGRKAPPEASGPGAQRQVAPGRRRPGCGGPLRRPFLRRHYDLRRARPARAGAPRPQGQHLLRRPARVSHVTDATDWRVEYPSWCSTRTPRRMAPLVKSCIELGLTIIPRGGGTGYTGGAVPLDARRWSSTPKS